MTVVMATMQRKKISLLPKKGDSFDVDGAALGRRCLISNRIKFGFLTPGQRAHTRPGSATVAIFWFRPVSRIVTFALLKQPTSPTMIAADDGDEQQMQKVVPNCKAETARHQECPGRVSSFAQSMFLLRSRVMSPL